MKVMIHALLMTGSLDITSKMFDDGTLKPDIIVF